jgi:hypothetical protein
MLFELKLERAERLDLLAPRLRGRTPEDSERRGIACHGG